MENNRRLDVFIATVGFVYIDKTSRTGQGITLNICHVMIQRTAKEVIISKASTRCLSSRFPDQHITRHSSASAKRRAGSRVDMGKKTRDMNLGDSLIESVLRAGAADVGSKVSEIALCAVLEEDLFRDVPVLGWLWKLYAVGRTVRDHLFLKKIALFLFGTQSATRESKEEFRKKTEGNLKFRRKVGENILLLLERHDSFDKSELLGRIFAEFVDGKIDYGMFLRIATSIDRVPISDLHLLPLYKERLDSYDYKTGQPFADILKEDTCQSLCTSGLVASDGVTEVWYRSNEVMNLLVKHINDGEARK